MRKFICTILTIVISAFLTVMTTFAESSNKETEEALKNQSSGGIVSTSQTSNVDEALQRVNEEEEYIVSLIGSLTKNKTSIENWEYNLQYLKNNYKDIQKKSKSMNIKMNYVNSYIEAYETVLLMKNSPSEKIISTTARASVAYDFIKAVDYANTYYNNYNTAYPDWTPYGGDCANFISQCLYAGGMQMKGTPGTDGAAQDFSNWFSKGSTCNTKNVSSTWRGADAFRYYWQNNAIAYKKFTSYTIDAWNYGFKGYAVSLLTSTGRAYHTLIIVGYDSVNKDLICAAHTGNTNTASLKSKASGAPGGFIIYKTW